MRGKSHRQMGAYLAGAYFPHIPPVYRRAFLLGCIEPDRNFATYFKGSIRAQWLRGHNYENAKRYMTRIAKRLETKPRWGCLDYYTAGKLIHYTVDAFTYAHNASFPTDLREHKVYEAALQDYFLEFLRSHNTAPRKPYHSVMETIQKNHFEYLRTTPNIFRDAAYAFSVSCCVAQMLSRQTAGAV